MRSVLRIILALLLFAALGAPSATRLSAAQEGKPEAFPSLDALIKQYDPAQCKECHETTHKEWGQSFHARSVLWSLGSLRAFVDALEKERKAPTDKTQMLKCLDCHAPMVNDATEAVVKEIVGLIKTAVDDKDDGKKKAARDKLSALSVNCTGCHTVKGTGDPLKPADPKVVYGPKGLTLGVEAVGYRHLVAGKYVPRAIVTVDVGNQAGHRIPDG